MDDLLQLPREALATLAIETWRLCQNLEKLPNQPNIVALRYSARKLRQTLENQGCSFLDYTGQIYDAGLAVEVIDIEADESKENKLIIKEMVVPIILFQNKLLVSGQVILGR